MTRNIRILLFDPHPARVGKLRKVLKGAGCEYVNLGIGIADIGGCIVRNSSIEEIKCLFEENKITNFKLYEY